MFIIKKTFACLIIVHAFCHDLLIFYKINHFKIFSQEYSQEYHKSVNFGSRSAPTNFSGLILVQTVCKGNQQTALLGKELMAAFVLQRIFVVEKLWCSIVSFKKHSLIPRSASY